MRSFSPSISSSPGAASPSGGSLVPGELAGYIPPGLIFATGHQVGKVAGSVMAAILKMVMEGLSDALKDAYTEFGRQLSDGLDAHTGGKGSVR